MSVSDDKSVANPATSSRGGDAQEGSSRDKAERRKALHAGATAALAGAGLAAGGKWIKPVIESSVLPAHSQTTTADVSLAGTLFESLAAVEPAPRSLPAAHRQDREGPLDVFVPLAVAGTTPPPPDPTPTPPPEPTPPPIQATPIPPDPDPDSCPLDNQCCQVDVSTATKTFVLWVEGIGIGNGSFTGNSGSTTIAGVGYTVTVDNAENPTMGNVTGGPGGGCGDVVVSGNVTLGTC